MIALFILERTPVLRIWMTALDGLCENACGEKPSQPPCQAVARLGAPREVFYRIISDGSDIPRRVKVHRPTFVVKLAVQPTKFNGNRADVPLIQASIDPRGSCKDR
jgi:NADH:ubiquinone oxidoreductase subunit D